MLALFALSLTKSPWLSDARGKDKTFGFLEKSGMIFRRILALRRPSRQSLSRTRHGSALPNGACFVVWIPFTAGACEDLSNGVKK
jgi:hypothetical protein